MPDNKELFTEEQLEILRKGFQEHDFTQDVSLSREYNLSGKEAETYKWLKKLSKGYMKSALPELGVNRQMGNFSADHPVNLLMNTDASYIAAEGTKIFENKKLRRKAIRQFFRLFRSQIKQATTSYCKAKGKTPKQLTEEDRKRIMDRVTQVVNEGLSSAVLLGQQIPELYGIAHDAQAPEDFPNELNTDAINFHNQWTHCKTQVGEMLSLDDDEDGEPEPCSPDADPFYQLILDAFFEKLSDTDAEIFRMREIGYTQAEIAEKLGYKNHSAVTKRLQAMRKQWDEFTNEYETK